MRTQRHYFCAKILLVILVTLLVLTTVWAEDDPGALQSTAVRYRGIQFTTPRPQGGGVLSNFFLSAAKIFENVQVAAERYLERRRVSNELRRSRFPVPPSSRVQNAHDAIQLEAQTRLNSNDSVRDVPQNKTLRRFQRQDSQGPVPVEIESAVAPNKTITNANTTAATPAPFQMTAAINASITETQEVLNSFPLHPQWEASEQTEVIVESVTTIASTTSISQSSDVDSSTKTAENPRSKATRRQVETAGEPSSSTGGQRSSVLGSIVRNVLPGSSVSSAASLLNDGRAPSLASTAKPESVQFAENLQSSQEGNAEDNFADLAAIPVLSDGDDDDNLETDSFPFPISQNGMPVEVTSLLPQAPSPSNMPISMTTTTRTTVSPLTTEPPLSKPVEITGPSYADPSELKSKASTELPFLPITLPPAPLASTTNYKDLSSSVLVKSARVQASVIGNGQQNLPSLNVSDFQNLRDLLTGLVSSLREGVSDSGKSHVFNINIGTINWNYGQNPHVIYNGLAEPERAATTYPGSPGASGTFVNLPVNRPSSETPAPAANIPSQSPAFVDSQASRIVRLTTSTTTSTTTTTESPDIDPRQPPKPGVVFHPKTSQSAFQASSVISNSNGPPVPLPPLDGFDEFEDFSSHESIAPVTVQPAVVVNSTENTVRIGAPTEALAELDLDVRILTGSSEKQKG